MQRLIGKVIVTSGILVALAGCGSSASSGSTQSNPAPAATTESSATTTWTTAPDAAGQAAPTDAGGQAAPADSSQAPASNAQKMPGVMGQVVSIDGTTLVVKGQGEQGTDITVTLNENTKYTKQATLDIASVPTGEAVTAMGTQDGDVFTATQVRVGAVTEMVGPNGTPQAGTPGGDQQGQGAPGGDQQGQGAPSDAGQQGGNGGTPPAGGQPDSGQQGQGGPGGGNRGQRLSGTVESVADGVLTVKTSDGTTVQVHLAENGQVTQQVDATQADITVGAQVMVVGEQSDSAVTATQVSIMPAATQQQ